MRTETIREPATPVRRRPPSLPELPATDISRGKSPARSSDPSAAHDATLLVAALEDLEAKRAAIEWLLDADLLWRVLV